MLNQLQKKLFFYCPLATFAVFILLSLFSLPHTAGAQGSKDLVKAFKSKPVTIYVGSSPGGGYDTFARLVGLFVAKHLPGNPRFIVKNVPGGGQLRGLRKTMRSKPDGLTIGVLHPRWVQKELSGVDVPDFDLRTVKVLGSPSGSRVTRIWCTRPSVAKSWKEVLQLGKKLTNGAQAPGASFGLGPSFVELTGGPIKMVYGYTGTSDVMAAFDRGELLSTDRCTEEVVPRLFPEWIENKILVPIFWWEKKPPERWLKRLGASMPPNLLDIVDATPEQIKTLEVAIGFAAMSRIFVMPPGVPDKIYQIWKSAFVATAKDPEFIKAANVAGYEVSLATSEDFYKNLKTFENLSPQGKELLKKLIGA